MTQLIIISLLLLSFDVSAISLAKNAGVNVTTSGSRATVEVSKSGGNAQSSVSHPVTVSGGSLHDSLAVDVAKAHPIPVGVGAAIAIPAVAKVAVDMLKKNPKLAVGAGVAVGVIACKVLGCEEAIDQGVEAIKKWLREAALGVDPDGNPTQKMPNLNCNGGTKSLQAACSWGMQFRPTATQATITKMFDGWTGPNGNYMSYCNYKDVNGDGVGSGVVVSCGYIDATTIDNPIATDEAEKNLSDTPISPTELDKIVEGSHAVAEATADPSLEVEGENPTIPDGDYTHKDNGDTSTNTNPKGEVAKKKEVIDCYKTSPSKLDCQKITDIETTKPDGSVSHDVTAEAPTIDEMGLKKSEPEIKQSGGFDCNLNPELIMCSKWGTAPTAEKLTLKEVPITIDNKSLGAGTCPAPKSINLSGGQTMSLSYQPECDFATKIKPIILAFAWLTAGFIVIGGAKES
jgi:hypothetical protein